VPAVEEGPAVGAVEEGLAAEEGVALGAESDQ
jgi:hypothetical protein